MILYLLEVICCNAVFLLIYQLFLRDDTFFLRNRIFLLAAPLLSFVLPFLEWNLSFLTASNEFAETLFLDQVQIYAEENTKNNILFWLFSGLITGTILYFIYLVIGIIKIANLLKHSTKEKFVEYTLVELNNSQEPFSFLNYIFLGKESTLSEAEKAMIIRHELAHIRGKHSFDIIYMELLCGFCWCIPLFFIYKKLLKEVHEFIADSDAAQLNGPKSYTRLMAQSTLNSMSLNLTHNFYQSPIITRLEMINKKRTPFVKHTKILMLAPVIVLLTFLFSCEGEEDVKITANGRVESRSLKLDESGEIYENLHHAAKPVGDYKEFYRYIRENIQYPEQAKRMGVSGKVYVSFIVDTDGSITNVKAIRGIGAGCDAEAERLLRESSKWDPAIIDGKYVKQRIVLNINFNLN